MRLDTVECDTYNDIVLGHSRDSQSILKITLLNLWVISYCIFLFFTLHYIFYAALGKTTLREQWIGVTVLWMVVEDSPVLGEGGWQVLVSIRKLLQGITSWPIHTPPVTMTYSPCRRNTIPGCEPQELLSFSHLASLQRRLRGMALSRCIWH